LGNCSVSVEKSVKNAGITVVIAAVQAQAKAECHIRCATISLRKNTRAHLRNAVPLGITVKTLSERGIRERLQPARAAVSRATKLNPKGCSGHLNNKPPNSPRAGPAGQHSGTAIPEGF